MTIVLPSALARPESKVVIGGVPTLVVDRFVDDHHVSCNELGFDRFIIDKEASLGNGSQLKDVQDTLAKHHDLLSLHPNLQQGNSGSSYILQLLAKKGECFDLTKYAIQFKYRDSKGAWIRLVQGGKGKASPQDWTFYSMPLRDAQETQETIVTTDHFGTAPDLRSIQGILWDGQVKVSDIRLIPSPRVPVLELPFLKGNYPSARSLIDHFQMERHVEGGFYKETIRDDHSTAIMYLLPAGESSALHYLTDANEVFHVYLATTSVMFVEYDPDQRACRRTILGSNFEANHKVQHMIPSGTWMGAYTTYRGPNHKIRFPPALKGEQAPNFMEDKDLDTVPYALMGCTVAPAFTFERFRLVTPAQREALRQSAPELWYDLLHI